MNSQEATPFTCPVCHSLLVRETENGGTRYRCNNGHRFTADEVLNALANGSILNTGRQPSPAINQWDDGSVFPRGGDQFDDITQRKKSEAALRESEEKYRSIFETIDEGFTVQELITNERDEVVDIIYREANEAFEQHTGIKNVVGRKASELLPHLEQHWLDSMTKVYKTGEPLRTEGYQADLGRWFTLQYSRVGGPGSRLLSVVFNDITERKQREEQQAFLLRLSDALRTEPTADAVANRALQMLIGQLGLDRSYITSYYLEDNRADLNYQTGNDTVPPLPRHFVLSHFPEALKAAFEGTLVIEDDWERQGLSEAEQRASRSLGMRAMVAATLRKEENKPLWSMVAISSRPRRWAPAEVKLVEEVAERTWAAMERARAEMALRQSEERMQLAASVSGFGMHDYDIGTGNIYWSPELKAIQGLPQDAPLSFEEVIAHIHPDDRERTKAEMLGALASESSGEFEQEFRIIRADNGEIRWLYNRSRTSFEGEGAMRRAVRNSGIAIDITARKKTEEALRQSEEQLRITMETAVDYAIINMDHQSLVQDWSRGAERIFEWTEEEMLGKSADVIFTPEDRAAGAPQKERATAVSQGYAPDERWHMRKDGTRFYMSGVMRPIWDSGVLRGFVKVARDLTERKEAEEALRVNEERYRTALQSADMATWDWNVATDTVVWNDQHFYILGLQPDGGNKNVAHFLSFVHADDVSRVERELKEALSVTGLYQSEFRIVRADNGKIRWMSGFGRAVTRGDQGQAIRIVGVMFDITPRKELEQQKDEFIGIASHELRTPVTVIKAYAEILQEIFEDSGDEESVGLMQKLDVQVDRLASLIYSLLDATRITEGKLVLEKTPFEIDELIKDTAEMMRPIAGSHRIELQPDAQVIVEADRERIRQVLINLMSNALKYSPGAERILVQSVVEGGQLKVCVKDFGIGISEEGRKKVFDRFFRDARAGSYSGLGLGLFISASIIHQHSGAIWVESKEGEGALFCFTLPIAQPNRF